MFSSILNEELKKDRIKNNHLSLIIGGIRMTIFKGYANGFRWFITLTVSKDEFEDLHKSDVEEIADRFGRVSQSLSDLDKPYIEGVVNKVASTCVIDDSLETFLISGSCSSMTGDIFEYKNTLSELVKALRKEFNMDLLKVEIMPIEIYSDSNIETT